MDHFEVDRALDTFTILVDTREQPTPRLRRRLEDMGCPYERQTLAFGDYSARCRLPSGDWLDLSDQVVVERKMSLDELCDCYTRARGRFQREFERAQAAGAKLYLLVEDASWEKAYQGLYRSHMRPQSLVASLLAWLARYRCQLLFCDPKTTGKLIKDILFREMKESLMDYECSG